MIRLITVEGGPGKGCYKPGINWDFKIKLEMRVGIMTVVLQTVNIL